MDSVLAPRQPQSQPGRSPPPSSTSFRPARSIGGVMVRAAALVLALGAVFAASSPSDLQPDLLRLLTTDLKFSAADIADLERGRIAKHTLPPTASGELAVAGGIRIHGNKARLLAAYRDI